MPADRASPADRTPEHAPPVALEPAARVLFAAALPVAVEFAGLLATEGVVRGLIGPREATRIWDRHLLNSAALAELVATGSTVVDVGSGAGLPGIPLSLARPDLSVVLVEPLERRTAFLEQVVPALGLAGRVRVVRGRAESMRPPPADVVTARAVAPLDRLAAWCLPLAALGGRLLAIKGAAADDEVAAYGDVVVGLGGSWPAVRRCGVGLLDPPVTVVEVVRERTVQVRSTTGRSAVRRSAAERSRARRGGARPGGAGSGGAGSGGGRGT